MLQLWAYISLCKVELLTLGLSAAKGYGTCPACPSLCSCVHVCVCFCSGISGMHAKKGVKVLGEETRASLTYLDKCPQIFSLCSVFHMWLLHRNLSLHIGGKCNCICVTCVYTRLQITSNAYMHAYVALYPCSWDFRPSRAWVWG